MTPDTNPFDEGHSTNGANGSHSANGSHASNRADGSQANGSQSHNSSDSQPHSDSENSELAARASGSHGGPAVHIATEEREARVAPPVVMAATATVPTGRVATGDDEESVDIPQVLALFKRRRGLMALVFLSIVALGVLFTAMQKPVYQATATILVSTGGAPESGNSNLSLLRQAMGGLGGASSMGTQLEILRAAPLQRNAIKRLPPAQQEEIRRFYKADVFPLPDASIIAVQVQSFQKPVATALADALVAEYRADNVRQNRLQVENATAGVRDQLASVRQRLAKAAAALKDYREKHGAIDLASESTGRAGRLAQVEGALRDARTNRDGLAAQIRGLRTQVARIAPSDVIPGNVVRAPRAEALRGQLNSLELRRIETAREYTPASRIMQDLDAQIRAIRAQIATAEKTEVGNWTPNPIRQGLLSDIARLEGQLRAEDARIAALGRATQRAKSSLDELPAHAYNLNRLNTDQEVLATTYRQLSQQFQTLRLSEEARANENRIFYPAELAPNPVAPRRLVNIAAAAILGLILALVAAVVSDQLDPRVHNTADVERAGGLPVLAHVPAIAGANGQSLLGPARPHPALLESYRMLRARLATAPGAPPLRSIVVAGPRGGEGTSTVAANLAAAIALGGRRVLLVDADLRRPALHRRLGLPNERGLSSVLGGSEVLAAALQATGIPRLSVLTAGPTVENAAELLSTEAGQRELLAIARHADVVVFDAPAVLVYADALSLSSLADAGVLVASEDESSRRDIERACDLLAQTGALLPGIVLNKAVQDTPKRLKRSGDNSNSGGPSGGPGGRGGNSIVAHATQPAESQVTR